MPAAGTEPVEFPVSVEFRPRLFQENTLRKPLLTKELDFVWIARLKIAVPPRISVRIEDDGFVASPAERGAPPPGEGRLSGFGKSEDEAMGCHYSSVENFRQVH